MQSPLEQGLVMEALDQPDNFPQVFKKYQGLLSFPEKGLYACICSFVEETYLKSFLKDIVRILLSCGAESVFSVIYVKTVRFWSCPLPPWSIRKRSASLWRSCIIRNSV